MIQGGIIEKKNKWINDLVAHRDYSTPYAYYPYCIVCLQTDFN